MIPGTASLGEWPLRDLIELKALPSAVPCARLHARHLLREWNLADLTNGLELITSELVTNALQASDTAQGAAPIRLWLLFGSDPSGGAGLGRQAAASGTGARRR